MQFILQSTIFPPIEGRPFTIVTNHGPLCYLFTTEKYTKIERRSSSAEFMTQFSTDIIHKSDVSNVIANELSRTDAEINLISTVPLSIQIAFAQENDDKNSENAI